MSRLGLANPGRDCTSQHVKAADTEKGDCGARHGLIFRRVRIAAGHLWCLPHRIFAR
jgi:hypothetical protein